MLHRPIDSTGGFHAEELHTESQAVVLPPGHPLTTRPHVHTTDITGLPGLSLPRWPGFDGTYPAGPGPKVRDHGQLLQLVALNRARAVSPASCRAQLHEDLAAVPVLDAPPVTTVIAQPVQSRRRPGPNRDASLAVALTANLAGSGRHDSPWGTRLLPDNPASLATWIRWLPDFVATRARRTGPSAVTAQFALPLDALMMTLGLASATTGCTLRGSGRSRAGHALVRAIPASEVSRAPVWVKNCFQCRGVVCPSFP
ncbi:hypothetical protein Sros01_04470 [Streptomyces roseochromogenus]|nr:hypothetical protein Sros01_04470 [Streptomyces roseochromogenus]